MLIWVSLQPSESVHQHSSKYERTSNYHHRLSIGAACSCKIMSNYRDLLVVLPFTDKGITSKKCVLCKPVFTNNLNNMLVAHWAYYIRITSHRTNLKAWALSGHSNIAAYLYNARIWKVNGHGWEWWLLWLIECKSSDWAQQWLCLFPIATSIWATKSHNSIKHVNNYFQFCYSY